MALLLILLSLLAFVGFGSGSSSVTSATSSATATATAVQGSQRWTGCVVVTWKAGQRAHQRPCQRAPAKP